MAAFLLEFDRNEIDRHQAVYDAADRRLRRRIPVGGNPGGIVVSPDCRHAFVVCAGTNDVQVIDTKSLSVTARVRVGQGPDGIAYWKGGL